MFSFKQGRYDIIECMKTYIILIDTNLESSRFHRQMCAYITGQVGECSVGKDLAIDAQQENDEAYTAWFDEHCVQKIDAEGCGRPCAAWITPGGQQYESVGIFVDIIPSNNVFEQVRHRAQAYAKKYTMGPLRILGFRLFEEEIVVTLTELQV